MDVSVGLPTTVPGVDGPQLLELARRAERCGFAGLGVLDRLVWDGYDALTALAAAAAVTTRVRLTTSVLLAAYRGAPAVLAKQLATIDHLSGHRLVVGVAAGGREDDFAAAGAAYDRRGRLLDEALAVFGDVWKGAHPPTGPRPAGGHIPLLVGGHSEAAMRRAARHATGWIAGGSSASSYGELVARARQAWADEGRTDVPRTVALAYVALGPGGRERAAAYFRDYYSYIGPKAEKLALGVLAEPAAVAAAAAGYAAAGCDELVLMPCTPDPAQADRLAEALA
jgi:alkanesulfonate monooxygenase SsuD/methylene tetrahydromethanopterin reductase-like flavin-dependent oxidoreductase (luciferase family)